MKKFVLTLLALAPISAFAQAPVPYTLLAPIGGMETVTLTQYLQGIFVVVIGIAGVLAVVMIVVCAIQMMGSPSVAQKSASKACITNAIFGLLLAVGSWIILNTINTNLLSNDIALAPIGAPAPVGNPNQPNIVAGASYTWSPTLGSCPQTPGRITAAVPPENCGGAGGGTCCGSVLSPIPPRPPTIAPTPPGGGFQNPFLPAPGGGTPAGGTPGTPVTPPITPVALPGVGFASSRFTVGETAGRVTITVTRTGPITGPLTLNYTTANQSAIAGTNYTETAGTLTFAAGARTQTFTVPIIDNTTTNGPVQFSVALSNPSGGTNLNAGGAAVIISDNESVAPTATGDQVAPIIRFINPVDGFSSSARTIPIDFAVTEATALRSVAITAVNSASGFNVFRKTVCSRSLPCAALGFTGTDVVQLSQFAEPGVYTITITACDAARNCSTQSVFGQYAPNCAVTDPRCSSDALALQNCIGKLVTGSCARADLNADGIINNADLLILAEAQTFDLNGDGIVDTRTRTTNFDSTCYFQTTQDPLLPCGRRVFGNIALTGGDKTTLGRIYQASQPTPMTLSVTQFNANLCTQYGCTTPGSGLGGTSQLSIYGEMAIATLTKYDFNGDGTVDANPTGADMAFFNACMANPSGAGCNRADINLDGYVTRGDMNFLQNAQFAWGDQPSTVTNLDRVFWSGDFQPEAGIIDVCQGAETILLCQKADLNLDSRVDTVDNTLLLAANRFDINNDGLIIYRPPTIAIRTTGATAGAVSTKFVINDVVSTTQSIIVRRDPGDASQFLGTIPTGALGRIIGGPTFVNSNWWWQVAYNGSFTGWSIETSLQRGTGTVTPPPPPVTPPSTLSTKFAQNERVSATANLNIRATAGINGTFVGIVPPNTTRGNIVGGPTLVDGYWWWQVRWDSGITGWSIETYMKELTPPPAPTIQAPSNNVFIASVTIEVRGVMPANEVGGTVRVYEGTTLVGQSVISASGSWSISAVFTEGSHTITAIATDQSENIGPRTAARTFTVDTIPPSAPTITAPWVTVVTGNVTLTGTASEAGTVFAYLNSPAGQALGSTNTGGGNWSLSIGGVVNGTYAYAIVERDRAGNVSATTMHTVTVNIPPPPPPVAPPATPPPPGNFALNCTDGFMQTAGSYHLLNDQWGKEGITAPFSQCTGMGPLNADGSASGRYTWQWPAGPNEVKGWPSFIFGQKPGRVAAPGSGLPRQVNTLNSVLSTWNTTSTFTGTGHLTFDLWLTRDPVLYGNFPMTPITHEIMVALEPYNGYGLPENRNPAWFVENVTLGGVPYAFYRADNFGCCGLWRFLVFQNLSPKPSGSLEFKVLFDYLVARGHILGTEYLSSVEFGTEAVEGTGDVTVNSFKTTVY